jgi:glycosyltransferase involved in cell wall biosynthesis
MVSGEYPPMRGGIGDYTHRLAYALQATGIEVTILCNALSPTVADDVPVDRSIPSWGWEFWRVMKDKVAQYRPDWLHIQYNASLYPGKAAILFTPLWLKRVNPSVHVAITFHDLQQPRLIPHMHALNRMIFYRSMAFHDLVVTTNESDYRAVQKTVGKKTSLYKIPIGSNILVDRLSQDDRIKLRARLGFGSEDFVIAHFGTRSGLAKLIEGFHILRKRGYSVGLLLIGKRLQAHPDDTAHKYEVLGEEVMAQLAQAGLSDKVVGTGYLPVADVSRHLQCADVLVLPHLPGISMARTCLLSGLVHGMPIVATIPPVMDPELESGRNLLLVESANAQALAEAVSLLQHDQSLRLRLQTGALALGSQITWPVIARKHIAAYREVE